MAHAILDRQFAAGFPAILDEPIERGGNPGRDGFPAQLRIVVEIAEQRVGHGDSRRQRVARVEKAKGPVLVDGGRGACGGELDVVVLPGSLDKNPKLDGVVVDDFRRIVGPRVDKTRPGSRIRTVVDGRQAVACDRG